MNSAVRLLDYNKKEIKQLGTCDVNVQFRSITRHVHFYIVSDRHKHIIGVSDALSLGLTSFHCPIFNDWQTNSDLNIDSIQDTVNQDSTDTGKVNSKVKEFTLGSSTFDSLGTLTKQNITNHPKYAHLFSGIGHFKCRPVHITMRQGPVPIQKPPRRVPIAMNEKFKQELDSMEAQGIISSYDGRDISPEWLNSFVIVKKPNGSLRICLDPTSLNKEIIRPVCNAQTMDDVVHKLKSAKYFAVFDTSKGFFHIPLYRESKALTAMLTPFGIYVYNVLAMGLSNATGLFETCIWEILQGLNGCTNIADDVLVLGTTYDEFKTNVLAFLDRCVQEDMHLNPDKVKTDCLEVPYFGNTLSKEGLSPDSKKVELIQQWPTLTNHKELQSFLGTVNYLSHFLAFLSDLCAPLQSLLKKDTELLWTPTHQHAFDQIMLHVSNDVKLQFYIIFIFYIEVNTSKKGIGAVMLQQDKIMRNESKSDDEIPTNLRPISYASKTLSVTESNYSNIECELLGLLFAVTHFKHFTYGRLVHVITDHKPLLSLFKKSLVDASPRLTRMLIELLDFSLCVVYQPSAKMHLSDAISQLSSHNNSKGKMIQDLNVSIHSIKELTGFNSLSVDKIHQHTAKDNTLQLLIQHINDGFPASSVKFPEIIKPFYNFREELSVCNGLILKGQHRIVIPETLRTQALQIVHNKAHLGLNKTLERARMWMYWPGITYSIKESISACKVCLMHSDRNQREPYVSDAIVKPWSHIALDNFEYRGQHFLMVLDISTKLFVVRPVSSLNTDQMIQILTAIFCEHGMPLAIRHDRGRNFVSDLFHQYCQHLGIKLSFSSAYHHSGNPAE